MTRGQSGTFEVTTINANASRLLGKVIIDVKIHVHLCGFFCYLM